MDTSFGSIDILVVGFAYTEGPILSLMMILMVMATIVRNGY